MSSPQIDLAKIQAEIGKLSDEQLRDTVLKLRVREKKQQKKNYGSPQQKMYQARQREMRKLMLAMAREKGLMDEIDVQANEQAEAELAEERDAAAAASEE